MEGKRQWYRFLCCIALLCWRAAAFAQIIATNHPLAAEVQLLQHLEGLENSWEVINSRATSGAKTTTGPGFGDLPLPEDAVLGVEMRYVLGEIKMEFHPKMREFIQLFARQRRSQTEAMLGVASIYAPVRPPGCRWSAAWFRPPRTGRHSRLGAPSRVTRRSRAHHLPCCRAHAVADRKAAARRS